MLDRLVTDACAEMPPWSWLNRFFPTALLPVSLRRVLGRRVPDIPAQLISGFPWFAVKSIRGRHARESQTEYWARRNAEFCRLVARKGLGSCEGVYGFNGAALEVFEEAKKKGLRIILDQTAAPWSWNRKMLLEEAERWPGWEERPAEIDESEKLSAREEREWELADRIICGSDFVVETVGDANGPAERCRVVHYPFPVTEDGWRGSAFRVRKRDEPFRVLFVGTLQLRKGVQYLLQAVKLMRGHDITVRLVGPSMLSEEAMKELRGGMDVVGPVPRSEISKQYAWADAFVLPTLSEGSANVVYEAMAAGVPVITTPHAGSIIEDGVTGLLVPARDAGALAQGIIRLREDRELREKIRKNGIGVIPGFEDYVRRLSRAVTLLPERR
ncbi:MAG: glycosyltransferase family 4 protein [Desulfobulbaceae bacterium]